MEIISLPGHETHRLLGILGELSAYHNEVSEGFAGVYPVYSPEIQMKEAGQMVEAGEARIDVVMENGDIAGFGMASFSGRNGEIEFLYLRPHLRRRGLGGKLYGRLLGFLKEHGVEFIDVRVVRGNPAKKFYQRHGFRPRSEVMSLPLAAVPPAARPESRQCL